MSSRILDFVLYTNQVILFVVMILAAIFLLTEVGKSFHRSNRDPTRIEIVNETTQPELREKTVYMKRFDRVLKDVYIIKLFSTKISPIERHRRSALMLRMASPSKFESDFRSSLANIMFVTEDNLNYMLFEKNCLITDVTYADFKADGHWIKLERNLYTAVIADTNGDGFLGEDDKRNLYVSDYNGHNLTLVLEDISSFERVQDNQILITQRKETDSHYYFYDVLSGQQSLLNTEI